jgi:GxxExxY protein
MMKNGPGSRSMYRKLLHGDEVYRIVGGAMEVSTQLGSGFLEAVYQEALALEFKSQKIPFEEQIPISIKYKQHRLKSTYVPDFLCFSKIIVEIKAIKHFTPREKAQILNYLKATQFQVGVLLNFGSNRLEWKRFILT